MSRRDQANGSSLRRTENERGSLISMKGWEGFIGKNGKVYRKKSTARKYGGGVA